MVVKADGLAAGKGVVVAASLAEARRAVRRMLVGARTATPGATVVVEEWLDGREASSWRSPTASGCALLPSAQDHKRVFDGDRGPEDRRHGRGLADAGR